MNASTLYEFLEICIETQKQNHNFARIEFYIFFRCFQIEL